MTETVKLICKSCKAEITGWGIEDANKNLKSHCEALRHKPVKKTVSKPKRKPAKKKTVKRKTKKK